MESVFIALGALIAITIFGILAQRAPSFPFPIILVLGGLLVSLIPDAPQIRLDPAVFFILFLPPLLYADGWLMNLRDFKAARRPILLLSIGLVIFTTLAVGWVVHLLMPDLPWSVCFALGAVISPTDAVAVSAITERLKVPHRIVTILNGESLVNDASGLVAFKFAVVATLTGTFNLMDVGFSFLWLSAGGICIGLIVAFLIHKLRSKILTDPNSLHHITISLLTPFAAYIPADALGVSGVLSAVAAGLYGGWADPLSMSPQTRMRAWYVWEMFLFWFNGLVFFLLGMQLRAVLGNLHGTMSWPQLFGYAALVGAVTIIARMVWVFPGAYLPRWLSRKIRETEPPLPWQNVFIVSWAGMRGAVTLAAALSIPMLMPDGSAFPGRELVIFLAFGVILITLLLNGLSLPWFIRKMCIRDDGRLDVEEKNARILAARSALLSIEDAAAQMEINDFYIRSILDEYRDRIHALEGNDLTHQSAGARMERYRHLRRAAIRAERETAVQLYRDSIINDDVLRRIQSDIDFEEARLQEK